MKGVYHISEREITFDGDRSIGVFPTGVWEFKMIGVHFEKSKNKIH